MSTKRRQCIVVLGMHRSGTSALTGVLQLLGVDLGKNLLWQPVKDNLKGFFENRKIHHINEAILKSVDSSWDALFPLPEKWWQQKHLLIHKQNAFKVLKSEFSDSNLFGIKDPRMCLLLPFWQQIFRELAITTSYVIIVRNPLEIAVSLAQRDHFSLEKSGILWMNYMLHADFYSRNHPRVFISFDDLLNNPLKIIEIISNRLAVKFPHTFQEIEQVVHEFLVPDLKHYSIKDNVVNTQLLSFMLKFYQILQNLINTPEPPKKEFTKIDRLRKNYYHESSWFYNKDVQNIIKALKEKESLLHKKEEEIQQLKPHYYAQLFIDTGADFREKHSIRKDLSGFETCLEFDLSDYDNITGLRFNPVNSMVVLKLDQIKIITVANILQSVTYSTKVLYQKDNLLIFDTDDPIISINIQNIIQPEKLVITLEYLAWGTETYKYISDEKSSIIMSKDTELQQQAQALQAKDVEIRQQAQLIQRMENTLSWKITKPLRMIWNRHCFIHFYNAFLRIFNKVREVQGTRSKITDIVMLVIQMINFIKKLFYKKQYKNSSLASLQNISDEKWFSLLCGDITDPDLKKYISDMPPEQTQLRFTGASGKVSLTQAFDFYKLVKSYTHKFDIDLRYAHVLEFGVGWGRIIRFFVKVVDKEKLYGVDPLPEIIELCRATVKMAQFHITDPQPPISPFHVNMFDVIYAYSVFSHLNEEYTKLWFKEFHRLLKNGGVLIVTTRSRAFIAQCAALRNFQQPLPPYAQNLNKVFLNTQEVLDDYNAGKFCHQATGGGDILSKDFFGESCIPRQYFVNTFSDMFTIEDFLENLPYESSQACVILRKQWG